MKNSNDAQIVLVMNEIDAINFRKKGYDKPGCRVIAYNSEFLDLQNSLVSELKECKLLEDKNVLVKSPYSSRYYCLEEASEKIHADYFEQYSIILGLLGAKRVSVTECNTVDSNASTDASGGANVNGVGGSVSAGKKVNSHQKALLELSHTFVPHLDISKAKKLVKDFGLQGDSELERTIMAIESGVKEINRKFNFTLSKKLKSVFNLAAEIQPYAGIDIKTKIENNKEITETYSLHIEVEYEPSLMR